MFLELMLFLLFGALKDIAQLDILLKIIMCFGVMFLTDLCCLNLIYSSVSKMWCIGRPSWMSISCVNLHLYVLD